MSFLAAACVAAVVLMSARELVGGASRTRSGWLRARLGRAARLRRAARSQIWLSQAGAAVTPSQFLAVSAGLGALAFVVLLGVVRAPVVASLPAFLAAASPFAYWASQRRKQGAARSAAWPDALRYLVGVLGAGVATLHDALVELSRSGPAPLRAPMGRYVRLARRLGARQALETVRGELADPVSDPVLLAFEGAIEEGTETALRALSDLGSQITSDIQLAERIRTLQTQSRMATWGCFSVPYGLLMFLCATNAEYRHFFSGPLGLAVVVCGALMSLVGLELSRRLVKPIATSARVFVREVRPWAI